METINYSISLFLDIEPFIKKYYGVDRNDLGDIMINSINSKDIKTFNSSKEDYFETIFKLIDSFQIKIYNYEEFHKIEDLCKKYNIVKDTFEYNVLIFMTLIFPIIHNDIETSSTDAREGYWEYVVDIRPEMLKLYIALHKGNAYKNKTRIAFGDSSPIKIDQKIPWLQMRLNDYLDKYLGVKDVAEAEKELLTIYGKTVGAKLNTIEATYIWGTYHLLQRIAKFKSKTKNRANMLQSKFIYEYIKILGLPSKEDLDSNILRSRLNYFLKTYDTLKELTRNMVYKTSPNNKGGMTYY